MKPWRVPEPLATAEVRVGDGSRFVLRRHGNPDGPRLVLSHGNGLASDLYYPFWSLLTDRFDLVLYDFRNHGWNARGDLRDHNIATFVSDSEQIHAGIDRIFGAKPRVGVFHSMSASAALAQDRPGGGFAALVLFDPPVYAPNADMLGVEARWGRQAAGTRKRQSRFQTTAELAQSVRDAPAFAGLLPGVAELFAETTLRAAADGNGFELRCPPEYEAQICAWALAYFVDPTPGDFACPAQVIGADPAVRSPFGTRVDLGMLQGIEHEFVSGASHFLQLEKPAECVETMVAFLERLGLAE